MGDGVKTTVWLGAHDRNAIKAAMRDTQWAPGRWITHQMAAEECGCGRKYITNILNGVESCPVEVLQKLADLLTRHGCEIDLRAKY